MPNQYTLWWIDNEEQVQIKCGEYELAIVAALDIPNVETWLVREYNLFPEDGTFHIESPTSNPNQTQLNITPGECA